MNQIMRKKPHSGTFKFKVALAAIKGDRTIPDLCQEFGIVASQLHKWKREFLDKGAMVFGAAQTASSDRQSEIDKLHRTIGKLKVENDFLEQVLRSSR